MRSTPLALALLSLCPTAAIAAAGPALTLYPGADAGNGYAIVRETRDVHLQGGAEVLRIPGLPSQLNADGLLLGFPNAAATRVDWQRLLAPGAGGAAQLDARLGQKVEVRGSGGQPLATGTLLRVDGDTLILRDSTGQLELVREWSAVSLGAGEPAPRGATLEVALDAAHAGRYPVTLTYPTRGLDWHAAYTARLAPGADCQLDLRAAASLSNQSGRDWRDAAVTLLAGKPRLAQQPMPMMRMAAASAGASASALPTPGTIGDYRSFALPQRVDLPDASVTVVPLYAPTTLTCARRYVATIEGPRGIYAAPYLGPPQPGAQSSAVESRLGFTAPHALPAGTARVYGVGTSNHLELLGEANINDTPPDTHVELTLGETFDLRSTREVTAFKVDRAAGYADESFRVILRNTGDAERTVTLRESPWRWRAWKLLTSSIAPAHQDATQLDFPLRVPAKGSATLNFALRYELASGNP
ncbi:MAG TPA: DUF4139 domain-containing protein [Rhodanobacteraceae bacterium]|nr:DUF4139 domain-containing protein [Rhodanobacteraceae bacterium]